MVALWIVAQVLWLPFSWWTLGLAMLWMAFCGLAITGGYHRLFSHMTYRAHWSVRLFYLLFGAASVQNSALKWSADHRRHHQFTDQDDDPYNIKKGFFWAHMGWVFVKENPVNYDRVPDLASDPLVKFQHRFYVPLAILIGWVMPTCIAFAWGDPIGAFFLAGWVRLIVQWHSTFSVNSFAHFIGRQPYSEADTSRDSFVTALITMGEGYHNYHHAFPWDYRNGVARHHFDPTKWVVHGLSKVGLTWNLKRVSQQEIMKARLAMEAKRLGANAPTWQDRIAAAKAQLEILLARWQALKDKYAERKRKLGVHARSRLKDLRAELAAAKADFKTAYRNWRRCLRRPELLPAVA